jgi:uncharacterized repeat protein (TIGR03806 family)
MSRAVSGLRCTCVFAIAVAAAACNDDRDRSHSDRGGAGTADAAVPNDDAGAPAADGGSDAATGPAPWVEPPLRMPQRSAATECRLPGTRADALPRVQPEPLGGELRFPLALGTATRADREDLLFVFEQSGVLHRVDRAATPASSQVVLDLRAAATCCGDAGLRGVAFHPDYAQNGWLFVHYVRAGTPHRSRIARFTADPATDTVDLASERVVLEATHAGAGREGGPLLFDRDGMLIVALGDGGQEPLLADARRPSDFAGAILRLDVAALDSSASYAIPGDNPFADAGDGTPPEVLAWGFRDPQHCSLDPDSGELWCSDRGPDHSELDLVAAGRSHGWPFADANACNGEDRLCLDSRYEAPQTAYRHFEGQCGIAGGQVFIEDESGLLAGTVLYGDACSGLLSGAAKRGAQKGKRGGAGMIEGGLRAVSSDGRGGVLAIDAEGRLLRLTLAPDGTPGTFPERLSDTGCYADLAGHEPAAELIEFRVRSPLWSDGTHKRRFMRLPDGAQIEASPEDPWEFPVGSLLVKQFALPFDDGDPDSVRPIETRFMVRRPEGWEFHNYRWNDDATDAELVREDSFADYAVVRGGEQTMQRYQFPGPATCPICHAVAPGRVLGPRTEQLAFAVPYEGQGEARDQLEVLADQGLFDSAAAGAAPAALPDPADPSLPIEQRARSYLHANCAHCHQPGGWSSPDLTMDLRYGLPLADAHICGAEPSFFSQGRALIAPGDPDESAILIRMRELGLDRMPPVATGVVDPLGEMLLQTWISELSTCP